MSGTDAQTDIAFGVLFTINSLLLLLLLLSTTAITALAHSVAR